MSVKLEPHSGEVEDDQQLENPAPDQAASSSLTTANSNEANKKPSNKEPEVNNANKEEEELMKRKRAVIVTFNGIFRFSKDLLLNCIPCDQDLPDSTLASLDEDVNAHTTSMEHLMAWSSFFKRESDGINKLLSSAIQDGVFVTVCDGYVRCNVCNNVISDSLAFLKRHLFNEKHRFRGAPLPMEAVNTYANPYGLAARKLTSLVAGNPSLSFATEKGQLFVNCSKCEKLMPRGYSEVHRHLKSKMHTNAARRKKRTSEEDEEEVITLSDDEPEGGGGNSHEQLATSSTAESGTSNKKARLSSASSAVTSTTTRSRSGAAKGASLKVNIDGREMVFENSPRSTTSSSGLRKPRGGKTRANGQTTSSSNATSYKRNVPTRGSRKVMTTRAIEADHLEDGEHVVNEGQIILMEALPGHDESMVSDDPNNHQQNTYQFIQVIHEEQVSEMEFVDGHGNAHTATVLEDANGQPTTIFTLS